MRPARVFYLFNGEQQPVSAIAAQLGIKPDTLRYRLRKSAHPEDAFYAGDLRRAGRSAGKKPAGPAQVVAGYNSNDRIISLWLRAIRAGLARCGATGQRVAVTAVCESCDIPCVVNGIQ